MKANNLLFHYEGRSQFQCVCVCFYLAAALARPIRAGTHSSLQVTGLAVRSGDVTLALGALWGKCGCETTPSLCYQQRSRLREELAECVLGFMLHQTIKTSLQNENVAIIFSLPCQLKHHRGSGAHQTQGRPVILTLD